jgi:hypothetical protein
MSLTRVIVNGGSFIRHGQQLIQEFANHVPVRSRTPDAEKVNTFFHRVTRNTGNSLNFSSDRPSLNRISSDKEWLPDVGHKIFQKECDHENFIESLKKVRKLETLLASNKVDPPQVNTPKVEHPNWQSRLRQAWDEVKDMPEIEALKEAGLAIGSGLAGDREGAIEHGLGALSPLFEAQGRQVLRFEDRSVDVNFGFDYRYDK